MTTRLLLLQNIKLFIKSLGELPKGYALKEMSKDIQYELSIEGKEVCKYTGYSLRQVKFLIWEDYDASKSIGEMAQKTVQDISKHWKIYVIEEVDKKRKVVRLRDGKNRTGEIVENFLTEEDAQKYWNLLSRYDEHRITTRNLDHRGIEIDCGYCHKPVCEVPTYNALGEKFHKKCWQELLSDD